MPHHHSWRELLLAYLCLVLSNNVLYAGPVYRAAAATAMGWSQEAVIGLAHSTAPLLWGWAEAFGFTLGASLVVRFATFTDLFAGPWLGRAVGLVAPGDWLSAALATAGGAAWIDAGARFRTLYTTAAAAALLWTLLSVVLTRVPRSSTPLS